MPKEIEVKIRLKDSADYERVRAMLGHPKAIEHQENAFFDTTDGRLGNERVVMRIRSKGLEETTKRYVLTVKGKAVLKDGVSQVDESEEEMSREMAQAILADPNEIPKLAGQLPLLNQLLKRFQPAPTWKRVGMFRTLRQKHDWEDYLVELDKTDFAHGTAYEIEIETPDALQAKAKMEDTLKQHGIPYTFSQRNKFVNMLQGTLL